MGKGQISIEFLMVFTALIAFVSVFAVVFSNLHDASLFALDVQNAERFSKELNQETDSLLFFGEGSSKRFSYEIINEWKFTSSGGENLLMVISPDGKSLPFKLNNEVIIDFEKSFNGKISLVLTKKGGKLTLSE